MKKLITILISSSLLTAGAILLVLQLVLDVIGDFGRTWRGEPSG